MATAPEPDGGSSSKPTRVLPEAGHDGRVPSIPLHLQKIVENQGQGRLLGLTDRNIRAKYLRNGSITLDLTAQDSSLQPCGLLKFKLI